MYYNSNKNSSEYYSAYKEELSDTERDTNKKNFMSLPKKVGIGILLLGVIGLGSTYLINNFFKDNPLFNSKNNTSEVLTQTDASPKSILDNGENNTDEVVTQTDTSAEPILENNENINDVPKIVISEDKLPKSIQIKNSESKINANIKQNATDDLEKTTLVDEGNKEHNDIKKQVISLTKTSNMTSDDIDKIVNLILEKKKEKSDESLEKQLLNAEKVKSPIQDLKENKHYNKIVISSKNNIINLKGTSKVSKKAKKLSKYEKALKPEIATRSNAMRIIVVKKGDTLSKLALRAYGNVHAYNKIMKANPEIIKNPNKIYIGKKLRIPR